jgi:hypothetical protein
MAVDDDLEDMEKSHGSFAASSCADPSTERRAFCSFEHQDEEAFLTVEWLLATGQSVAG